MWKSFGKDGRLRENIASGPGTTQGDVDWSSSPGMAFFRSNIESFIFEVQRDGALPVLVAQATLAVADLDPAGRKRIRYNYVRLGHDDLVEINDAMVRVLAKVAAERNVPFIDPRPFVNGSLEVFSDHVHLTARGSRRLAEVLASDLAKAIVERPGSDVGSKGSTVL